MPKFDPQSITKQNVFAALTDLDDGVSHPFGAPTKYELLYAGKRYPPKAVVGLAHSRLTGQTLGPEDFSGGEAPGQANYILRNLGFDVVSKTSNNNSFITSRNFALPTDATEMTGGPWFNMWQGRQWPYHELHENDTLYWYDKYQKAVVWQSVVSRVERYRYANKNEAQQWFIDTFDVDVVGDPYFTKAPVEGYVLAYTLNSVMGTNVPKPVAYRLPQLGWLRSSDKDVATWFEELNFASRGHEPSQELSERAEVLDETGYFSIASLKDEREKKLVEITQRQGQPQFRNKLLIAYEGRCAVTGCDAINALEAAHIIPYAGQDFNDPRNGLLLRADIHTLFDLDLIGIEPVTYEIRLAPEIESTAYAKLKGQKVRMPRSASDVPSHEALHLRWQSFQRTTPTETGPK